MQHGYCLRWFVRCSPHWCGVLGSPKAFQACSILEVRVCRTFGALTAAAEPWGSLACPSRERLRGDAFAYNGRHAGGAAERLNSMSDVKCPDVH